jgi:hypothetical protein
MRLRKAAMYTSIYQVPKCAIAHAIWGSWRDEYCLGNGACPGVARVDVVVRLIGRSYLKEESRAPLYFGRIVYLLALEDACSLSCEL